jgi:hypothetical protein
MTGIITQLPMNAKSSHRLSRRIRSMSLGHLRPSMGCTSFATTSRGSSEALPHRCDFTLRSDNQVVMLLRTYRDVNRYLARWLDRRE